MRHRRGSKQAEMIIGHRVPAGQCDRQQRRRARLTSADLVDGCETFLLAYELVNDHVASEARREVPAVHPGGGSTWRSNKLLIQAPGPHTSDCSAAWLAGAGETTTINSRHLLESGDEMGRDFYRQPKRAEERRWAKWSRGSPVAPRAELGRRRGEPKNCTPRPW